MQTRRFVQPIYRLPIEGKWCVIKDAEIVAMSPAEQKRIDDEIFAFQLNPLGFACVHGAPNKEHGNDGLSVVNDYEHDLIIVVAPNRVGKTTLGAIFVGLRLVPTEPYWPCYVKHGFRWRAWGGPKTAVVATYSWSLMKRLYMTYVELLPRQELGAFAPHWGSRNFPNERGRPRSITFGDGKGKEVELACGSQLIFLCYMQRQAQWESFACDIAHLDEQSQEKKFDALTARQTARPDPHTPVIITMTPHNMDDRPDTGANGWVVQRILRGRETKGRKVLVARIGIEDTPEAIYSTKDRERMYQQCIVEPMRRGDPVKIAEGRARYCGEPQECGGTIITNWSRQIHVVSAFDFARFKPTLYRMIDHGEDPCAALVFAVFPNGQAVVVREYYEFGRKIRENSVGIVEGMCGNKRTVRQLHTEGDIQWQSYEEIEIGMEFYSSELDSRSFNMTSNVAGMTIGNYYNDFGCRCIAADGRKVDDVLPILKEWLTCDPGREHINKLVGRAIPDWYAKLGAPRLYVFDTLVNTISEIEGWVRDYRTGKPVIGRDHLISCLRFFVARDRPYVGDYHFGGEGATQGGASVDLTYAPNANPYTKY